MTTFKKLSALLALILVVCVVFAFSSCSLIPGTTPDGGEQEEPSVNTGNTALQFVLPIDGATVIREASLDKLVYMPSLNMWRTHNGIDVTASENAPVKSIANGKVSKIEQTTLEGVVVTVTHENGLVSVYKSLASSSVKEGDEVKRTGRIIEVPVGDGMLGRVVNPLGQPIDGQGPIVSTKTRPIELVAPGVMTRQSVNQPLQTGITFSKKYFKLSHNFSSPSSLYSFTKEANSSLVYDASQPGKVKSLSLFVGSTKST